MNTKPVQPRRDNIGGGTLRFPKRSKRQSVWGRLLCFLADVTARLRDTHIFATTSIAEIDGSDKKWTRITDYVASDIAADLAAWVPCETLAKGKRT